MRRVPDEVLAQRHARPEHGDQPVTRAAVGAQRLPQRRIGPQPGQCGQGEIGIGGTDDGVDQVRVGPGHVELELLGEQAFRLRRVGESHRG